MANNINNDNPLIQQLGIQDKQAQDNKKRTTLGQEDFLNLMITQLRNQDPMKPTDNGEFIGQMAQFSTVAGQQDMQKSIDNLSNSLVSSQALQASSLVGRFVLAPSDAGYLPEGEGERFFGAADLPSSTNNLTVNILTESGQLVKSIPMGNQNEGMVRFSWDGTNQQGEPMPAGVYKISANAYIDNDSQAVDTLVVAPVESVTLGRGGQKMSLNVSGLGAMDLDSVREIL